MQLLRDPSVRFAGYFHPHPLVHFINLKIQTNNSTVAPVEVLSSAIEDLANETDHLITQFTDSVRKEHKECILCLHSIYACCIVLCCAWHDMAHMTRRVLADAVVPF